MPIAHEENVSNLWTIGSVASRVKEDLSSAPKFQEWPIAGRKNHPSPISNKVNGTTHVVVDRTGTTYRRLYFIVGIIRTPTQGDVEKLK